MSCQTAVPLDRHLLSAEICAFLLTLDVITHEDLVQVATFFKSRSYSLRTDR